MSVYQTLTSPRFCKGSPFPSMMGPKPVTFAPQRHTNWDVYQWPEPQTGTDPRIIRFDCHAVDWGSKDAKPIRSRFK